MRDPATPAGRDLLHRHPELTANEIAEVERQAGGLATQADIGRRERVVDALRLVLTLDQRAAITAVLRLDPDAIESLDEGTIRLVLGELADPTMNLAPEDREAARARASRFLEEIM